ncbi:MAG: N-acetylmuramoyl-L-alanine amidase, partial [Oscillospiraceae bacterium]|nr:N-acetylmuramoyl-L-alanine amidase [Oscillospiraceae bacterium]
MRAYVTLDVNMLLKRVIKQGGGLKEGFSAAVHKFAMKYICDGLILTNYYTADSDELHAEYLRSGSGIGYENWLYETNRYIMRTVSEVIRKTTCTTAVGLYIEDMWANSSVNEQGSDTSDDFQALYDGCCDTKAYIEQGFADFILVKAEGSTDSAALNYSKVVSWWNELSSKSGVKMYVCHLNENIGNVDGWREDQLLKQLAALEDLSGIGGSAFNSFAALNENKLDSTTKLIAYFNDQINTGSLSKELEISSPAKRQYTTTDSSVKFQGTFDENFDVYFNGEKIILNEVGTFFIEKHLNAGNNYFTIEHKGEKMDYVINRYIDVIQSVENIGDITVEGGTRIELSAIVYSGSNVSASINGDLIHMNAKQSSDKVSANGSYSEYVGYYTVPDGIIGKEQKLGKITYYAVYNEPGSKMQDEYEWGGTITVEAKPEPPKTDISYEIIDQSTAGSGEIVGTMDPVVTEYETVKYIKVLNDYTHVYDAKTTGTAPSPVFSEMPANTLDYYKSSYKSDNVEYYISTTGRRYRKSDVKLITDKGIGDNALVVKSVGNMKSGKSFIEIGLDLRVTFNVTVDEQYHTEAYGQYGVSKFDAQYVYITFDNVTSVTKLPDFSNCSMFSEGKWETITENGVPKFRMKLKLRQAGIYSGVAAEYNGKTLMLTFNIPTPTLAGKVIMIDPGHGWNNVDPTVWDPGVVGVVTEQEIALAVAKKLEAKLTEMGATVIRLHTEEKHYWVNVRAMEGVKNDVDMYVSLHCNGSTSASAYGVEAYYFTPFSQPLAEYINNNLASLWNNTFYGDGTNTNRGDKYSYYHVTLEQSFPSVLVEMGFASNKKECLIMANPDNQTLLADRIADGIKSYFTRSNLTN